MLERPASGRKSFAGVLFFCANNTGRDYVKAMERERERVISMSAQNNYDLDGQQHWRINFVV